MASIEDFSAYVNDVSGTHFFALLGVFEQGAEVGRRLTKSAELGNNDPSMFIGPGDPNEIEFAPYLSWKLRDLGLRLVPGGDFSILLGQMWVATIYGAWDAHFQKAIAAELGLSKGALACDEMGDLRLMRNDILHHRGIAGWRETRSLRSGGGGA
jgi:hypothetical protein